jgi:hypothetical protein
MTHNPESEGSTRRSTHNREAEGDTFLLKRLEEITQPHCATAREGQVPQSEHGSASTKEQTTLPSLSLSLSLSPQNKREGMATNCLHPSPFSKYAIQTVYGK